MLKIEEEKKLQSEQVRMRHCSITPTSAQEDLTEFQKLALKKKETLQAKKSTEAKPEKPTPHTTEASTSDWRKQTKDLPLPKPPKDKQPYSASDKEVPKKKMTSFSADEDSKPTIKFSGNKETRRS